MRAVGSGAGTFPRWDAVLEDGHLPGPEGSRSSLQRSGDGWVHSCFPADTRSDCTGASLLLGCREAAGLASETVVVNAT